MREQITVSIDGIEYEGRLGTIRSTMLGREDHGIATAMLDCEGDGWGQGAGGYDLRANDRMVRFVLGVCDALGVDSWEKVAGRQVMLLYRPDDPFVRGIKSVVGGKPFFFDEETQP